MTNCYFVQHTCPSTLISSHRYRNRLTNAYIFISVDNICKSKYGIIANMYYWSEMKRLKPNTEGNYYNFANGQKKVIIIAMSRNVEFNDINRIHAVIANLDSRNTIYSNPMFGR